MGYLIHSQRIQLKYGKERAFAMNNSWPIAKIEVYWEKIVITHNLFLKIIIDK